MPKPVHFLKSLPTERTVTFAGEYIDLRGLADATELNYSYLSHIFSASSPRLPSMNYGIKLADALGMEFPDFIAAIQRKKREKQPTA